MGGLRGVLQPLALRPDGAALDFRVSRSSKDRQGSKKINQKPGRVAMAVTQAIPITRHPFADGSYKKMLIDGKWIDAASGKLR